MTSQTVARTVHVHGRVQGVLFRDSCRREAERHGLAGWVRNEPDGSVRACFEGDPDAVQALVSWCRTGPSRAHVERVDLDEEAPIGRHGFDVVG